MYFCIYKSLPIESTRWCLYSLLEVCVCVCVMLWRLHTECSADIEMLYGAVGLPCWSGVCEGQTLLSALTADTHTHTHQTLPAEKNH